MAEKTQNSDQVIDKITQGLVIIGALNWGLISLTGTNFISRYIDNTSLVQIIYMAVGISGLYIAWVWFGRK